jgi:hypothetical protein
LVRNLWIDSRKRKPFYGRLKWRNIRRYRWDLS